jgi:hypothetical protein
VSLLSADVFCEKIGIVAKSNNMIIILYFMFIECNKRALGWSTLFESKIEFERKIMSAS